MSENLLSKIIAEQTEILLKNINSVVQSANLEAEFDGLNASRFIFHTLHSLDKWFVNPAEYKYDENSSGGVAENLSVISSYRQGFDAAPVIQNGRTLVPIRYVAEKLDANVIWVPATQQIIIVR